MYTPDHFALTEPARIAEIVREYPFAALVNSGPDGLNATHVPTVFKPV